MILNIYLCFNLAIFDMFWVKEVVLSSKTHSSYCWTRSKPLYPILVFSSKVNPKLNTVAYRLFIILGLRGPIGPLVLVSPPWQNSMCSYITESKMEEDLPCHKAQSIPNRWRKSTTHSLLGRPPGKAYLGQRYIFFKWYDFITLREILG